MNDPNEYHIKNLTRLVEHRERKRLELLYLLKLHVPVSLPKGESTYA